MPEAVLVSAVRIPVGRAPKGALSASPDSSRRLVWILRAERGKCR